MLIFDRENWPYHRTWFITVTAATAVATAWYLIYGFSSGVWNWPAGSSPPGFAYGVVGGAIILFEMLLWPRKSLWRGRRLGRTKLWMTAHLWLGLLTLPLLLLHGSFHFQLNASPLAAVLMWLLLMVVGSGVFGLLVQNVVPRLMLERLPAETITSQIGEILGHYRIEAERLVRQVCGDMPVSEVADTNAGARAYAAVETVRQVGRVQGKVVQAELDPVYVPQSEPLRTFYDEFAAPYLAAKSGAGLPLSSARRAAALFEALRGRLRPEAQPMVARLSDLCDQRRQFDLQRRMQNLLFTWLGVHVALSVALLVLMFAHIFLALKYV